MGGYYPLQKLRILRVGLKISAIMKYLKVKGTRDILPAESELREQIWTKAKAILKAYGYGIITTPTFEYTELFVRSVGETTDIVEKEMYSFKDRGGRSLTLRPEGTAGVIRAFLENHMVPPVKLAYFENMFRAERPQKGRFREFWQIGVEFIGPADPLADAEIIEMGLNMLRSFGIEDVKLEINSIGMPQERKAYREKLLEYLRDKRDELCDDCKRRMERNPLRVLDCKIDAPNLIDAPKLLDFLSEDSRDHFDKVLDYLRSWGIGFEINPRLVRGLDYYTKTVFEFKFSGLGAQDTLLAGGRYDLLVEELGGRPTPAVGFAMGVERIILALGREGVPPKPKYFIVTLGEKARNYGIELLRGLRQKGISAEISHDPKSLRAQMKLANRLGARYALIIGEDELAQNKVKLRDMESGVERLVDESELT